MNTKLLAAFALPLAFALTGCSVADASNPIDTNESALAALTVAGSETLAAQLGAHALPTVRLPLAAFDATKIGALVNQTALTITARPAGVELSVAPGAHLSLDRSHGGFLLTTIASGTDLSMGTEGSLAATTGATTTSSAHPDFDWHPAAPGADAKATTNAVAGAGTTPSVQGDLALLGRWGIPTGEILRSFGAQTMAANHENGVAQTPTVHHQKGFVIRGFAGIGVRGHRAVVSRAPDGRIARVLANWPALASTGHKLSTQFAAADLVTLGTRALAAEGIKTGNAKVSLEYVPTLLTTGECVLKLTGVAKVTGSEPTGDHGDEARTIDFDVAAY